MIDVLVDFVSGSLYGAVITLIVLPAAIVYGAWQGIMRLVRSFRR